MICIRTNTSFEDPRIGISNTLTPFNFQTAVHSPTKTLANGDLKKSLRSSKSFNRGHFGTAKQSIASIDPTKKSVVKNTITHHGKVTNLQDQVTEQKKEMKVMIQKQVKMLRT